MQKLKCLLMMTLDVLALVELARAYVAVLLTSHSRDSFYGQLGK